MTKLAWAPFTAVVVAEIGKTKITQALPDDLKQVNYVGFYTKQTTTDFSAIKRVE